MTAGLPMRGRVHDLGHESAAEHEGLELQRRVQQPDQAEAELEPRDAARRITLSAAHALKVPPPSVAARSVRWSDDGRNRVAKAAS